MLGTKRLAGFSVEVHLRNAMKPASEGFYHGFENQDRRHQKSEIGVPVAPQKRIMSSKIV